MGREEGQRVLQWQECERRTEYQETKPASCEAN